MVFGLLSKKPRAEVGAVAGFGKIPAAADFVRTPNPSEEVMAFEAWLTRAMETGEARAGAAFKDGFVAARPHAFLWSGAIDKKTRGVLAGVVLPSHDAVGRRFPLVVCAPLPPAALASQPHLAPLVLHDFFHHAAAAAARAVRMATPAEFHAQVAATAQPSLDTATSLARYQAWVTAQRAADVWTSMYGDDALRASRWALYVLVEATSPYRGQDTPPLSLGIRAPLGFDAQTTSAFWIDLVRRAAGWKTTIPTLFVPLGSDSPRVLIQLGAEAPASVLADLYVPSPDSEAICELVPGASSRLPNELPSSVDAAASSALLSQVIDAIGR